MINYLAHSLNFTWDCLIDPNQDWGLSSKIGKNDTVYYTGVSGAMVNKTHDFSLSGWIWVLERDHYLDFSPILSIEEALLHLPRNPSLDYELFFRPFTNNVWVGICGITLILGIFSLTIFGLSSHFGVNIDNMDGIKIMFWIGSVFFILINSYYGGAMTMFFSTEPTMPFEDMQGVLKQYPNWELIIQESSDILITSRIKGNPLLAEYLETIK